MCPNMERHHWDRAEVNTKPERTEYEHGKRCVKRSWFYMAYNHWDWTELNTKRKQIEQEQTNRWHGITGST